MAFADRVAFVGVDTSESDPRLSERLLANAHAHYPVGLDTPDLAVADDWGVESLPVTFFLRRDSTIAAEHLGAESTGSLRKELEQLLNTTR